MHYLLTPSYNTHTQYLVNSSLRTEYCRRRRQNLQLTARLAASSLPDINASDPAASTSAQSLDRGKY